MLNLGLITAWALIVFVSSYVIGYTMATGHLPFRKPPPSPPPNRANVPVAVPKIFEIYEEP